MAQDEVDTHSLPEDEAAPGPRWLRRAFLLVLALLIAALALAWFSRERIARDVIGDLLRDYDLPASYEIESIGPERQVLDNVVIGDPDRPDLTVERVIVNLRYRLGTPAIGRVTLVRPRLFGTYRGGTLSFGALDKVLFRDTGEPPGLPDLDLKLVDGRALLETDYGPVGFKAAGEGELDSGFAGIIAATAPELDAPGCRVRDATLFGKITSLRGEPSFDGPVRLGRLDCPRHEARIADAVVQLQATGDADFAGVEAQGSLAASSLAGPGAEAGPLSGEFRVDWGDDRLNGRYEFAASGFASNALRAQSLRVAGALRGAGGFERIELETSLSARGVQRGTGIDAALADLGEAGRDTLLGPIVTRIRAALQREAAGSRLGAEVTLRKTGDVITLVVPQAELVGSSGARLLNLSRFHLSNAGAGPPRFSGNVATGGPGLPRIVGRMERAPGGRAVLRLRMAEYGGALGTLAVPELVVAQAPDNTIGFAGRALVSGTLPGGVRARDLVLPLNGNYTASRGLALWRRCTELRFDRLQVSDLLIERRGLTLCPRPGQAIVESGPSGLRIAAGAPSLDLAGQLAGTPMRLRSGPVGFAWPGVLTAREIDVALGPAATASRFRISDLDARLGGELGGTFADAEISLFDVPLDLVEASGDWRYTGGQLAIGDAAFILNDRAEPDRFNPLRARGSTLVLEDNVITAAAELRDPGSDRVVTQLALVHNLATGRGHADLDVPGLLFDERLQPDQLSRLALGVIANARGVVTGEGRIDWDDSGVTSSGSFSTESLDFAAAFGPVRGASGTIRFTDLLNLTTAPNQRLRVASVNPGIEVLDGEIVFALSGGELLAVEGGSWPFMGGTLTLRAVDLNLGVSEERRYVFEIEGLHAAQFVESMELGNISATGIFDGTVPIVFDAEGTGRIEGGLLLSRPPGGNVSYVGELTYEDLTPIANFAFDALRSLDYQQMRIAMDGNLTGEIVTRVRFDGVTQGAGSKQNFITKRLANLPIRFNVNIRAPFYKLITSIKAMYDPAFVRDPREIGLIDREGRPLRGSTRGEPAPVTLEDIVPDEPPIQPKESETMP